MREYAWYSPEFDIIIFQIIMESCYISFEWDHSDLYEMVNKFGQQASYMNLTTWVPLGEL